MDLGIEWFLIWKAIELESLRCIVSHQERVVGVRPTYALFSLATQSPREHLNKYTTLVLLRSFKNKHITEVLKTNTPYTSKQHLMMVYEVFESAPDNFGKFIYHLKLRHLSENLKGSKINYTDKIWLYYLMKHA